jgi:hypothetical protein
MSTMRKRRHEAHTEICTSGSVSSIRRAHRDRARCPFRALAEKREALASCKREPSIP